MTNREKTKRKANAPDFHCIADNLYEQMEHFCPFLKASRIASRCHTYFMENTSEWGVLEECLGCLNNLADQPHPLNAYNIFVSPSEVNIIWPHWYLKYHFFPMGLMFGRFKSNDDNKFPKTKFDYLSIRVGRGLDISLLSKAPELIKSFKNKVADDSINYDLVRLRVTKLMNDGEKEYNAFKERALHEWASS